MGTLLEAARKITNARMANSLSPKEVGSVLETMAKRIEELELQVNPSTNVIVVEFPNRAVESGMNTITHNKNRPVVGVYVLYINTWIPYAFSVNGSDPDNKVDITMNNSGNVDIRILLGSFTS